ncbi:hypothetical protein BDW59DRAFT_151333 [Aspergillus cavernicola]|uniref:Uncharacterized protein n=1 Tax=Aspergillus cavernicola TaxID=176166 RepID=A0ABR4HVL4_9EURO
MISDAIKGVAASYCSAFYLVCRVIGTQTRSRGSNDHIQGEGLRDKLFANDGLYRNFLDVLIAGLTPTPIPLDSHGRGQQIFPLLGCFFKCRYTRQRI